MDFQEYLKNQKIFVDDPYDQPNLRPKTKLEVGRNHVMFDNYYRVKGERVYCHICGAHRHLNGITGILEDETRILFGKNCAQDYFGPEVTQLCVGELRRRTSDAHARFRVLALRSALEPLQSWLESYRPLVRRCQDFWVDFRHRYGDIHDEFIDHLSKNSGRFIEYEVETLTRPDGKKERFQKPKIIGHIRSSNAITHLTKLKSHLALVDSYVSAIEGVDRIAEKQAVQNLYRMYKKMTNAASIIDDSLSFTSDLLSDQKLQMMSQWLETRRKAKLDNPRNFKPRNVERLVRRMVGDAFPVPHVKLTTILESIHPQNYVETDSDSNALAEPGSDSRLG